MRENPENFFKTGRQGMCVLDRLLQMSTIFSCHGFILSGPHLFNSNQLGLDKKFSLPPSPEASVCLLGIPCSYHQIEVQATLLRRGVMRRKGYGRCFKTMAVLWGDRVREIRPVLLWKLIPCVSNAVILQFFFKYMEGSHFSKLHSCSCPCPLRCPRDPKFYWSTAF